MSRGVVVIVAVGPELARDRKRAVLVARCVDGGETGLDLDCLSRLRLELLRPGRPGRVEHREAGRWNSWRVPLALGVWLGQRHCRLGRKRSWELRV